MTECDLASRSPRGVIESAARARARSRSRSSLDVDGAAPIRCDENKLRQVLVNLVDNAVKYSPEGGRVELRVRSENGSCQIEVARRGTRHPARRARADLREVLPARPAADPGRRRQRARPLHLPRAGRAHERAACASSPSPARARASPSSCRSGARCSTSRTSSARRHSRSGRRSGSSPPELVREIESDWGITVGEAFPFSTEAFVATVTCADGTPAVLKLIVPRGGDAAARRRPPCASPAAKAARGCSERTSGGERCCSKSSAGRSPSSGCRCRPGTRSSSPRRSGSGGRRPTRGCPPATRRRAASVDSSPRCGTSSAAPAAVRAVDHALECAERR